MIHRYASVTVLSLVIGPIVAATGHGRLGTRASTILGVDGSHLLAYARRGHHWRSYIEVVS